MANDITLPDPPLSVLEQEDQPVFWPFLGLAATGAQFYHGYKRNEGSIGWGLLWAFSGVPAVALGYFLGWDSQRSVFLMTHVPPLGVAGAQGFAKPIEKPIEKPKKKE